MVRTIRRLLGAAALIAAVCAVGALASGLMISVVTDGTSMVPSHHAGDLVIAVKAGSYSVGDVVAYRDASSGKAVLHRIVGGDERGYDLRGDHNTSIDPTHPTADDLLGREALHVPRVGVAFRTPVGLAGVLAVVALVGGVLLGVRRRPKQAPPGAVAPRVRRRPRRLVVARVAIVVVDLAVVAGVVASFVIRPHTVPVTPVARQTGSLAYATQVPVSDVYPDGELHTGDPVFLQLVDRLDLVFDYRTRLPVGATASGHLWAVLVDGSGWSRQIDLTSMTPVLDGRLELHGSLDLGGIRALVGRVTAATGLPSGPLQLEVIAEVDVVNDATSVPFRVSLPLQLNELALHVDSAVTLADGNDDGISDVTSTATIDGSELDPAPRQEGGVPGWVRQALLGPLLVVAAASVVSWPTNRDAADADDPAAAPDADADTDTATPEDDTAPASAPVVAVSRLVLPVDAVLVEVSTAAALDVVALANTVPVFESTDGTRTVITGLAIHRWRPPAATPTEQLPVTGRRLFGASRPVTPVAAVAPPLDELIQYLADPEVHDSALRLGNGG